MNFIISQYLICYILSIHDGSCVAERALYFAVTSTCLAWDFLVSGISFSTSDIYHVQIPIYMRRYLFIVMETDPGIFIDVYRVILSVFVTGRSLWKSTHLTVPIPSLFN